MAVRKMLWKHTENLGIPLNEKLLSAAAYKTILQSPGKLYKDSYNLCTYVVGTLFFDWYHLQMLIVHVQFYSVSKSDDELGLCWLGA